MAGIGGAPYLHTAVQESAGGRPEGERLPSAVVRPAEVKLLHHSNELSIISARLVIQNYQGFAVEPLQQL